MRKNYAEKLTYLFIAFAIYLFLRAFGEARTGSIILVLLYASVAISLLASNVPKVVDVPLQMVYPVRCVEFFTFGLAVVCFIALFLKRILLLV